MPAGADILLCAVATHSNAHTLGRCGQVPGSAAPGCGPDGLIPAIRRRRRRGAGRQAPVASQGRPAAPATPEQGSGGGLSQLPPHLGSLVPMARGGGKPWFTSGAPPAGALVPVQLPLAPQVLPAAACRAALCRGGALTDTQRAPRAAPVLAHGWELGLGNSTYNWLHVFEDSWVGLYVIDRGCIVRIPDGTLSGMLNGCSGWLRGAAGVWHRQAGYYLLQCAATHSRDSLGADLARGQLPVCCCPHGRCCGGAAGDMLPPVPQPCLRGPQ